MGTCMYVIQNVTHTHTRIIVHLSGHRTANLAMCSNIPPLYMSMWRKSVIKGQQMHVIGGG